MPIQKQSRRGFAKTVAAGTAAIALDAFNAESSRCAPAEMSDSADDGAPANHSASNDSILPPHRRTTGTVSADRSVFREAARDLPVADSADVVVCGGGPAGVAAALAAARMGANTRLLEVNGCLGGVWTAGALSLIIDGENKPGIMRAIARQLQQRRTAHGISGKSLVYDPESMKLLLEQLSVDAGVAIQLHTRVVGAIRDDRNRLAAVLTESKSGRQAWLGRVFVDCTGDGDVAALAGCHFDIGRPETGVTQPMSLMALLAGPPIEAIARFVRGDAEPRNLGNPKVNLLAEMRRADVDPSYHGPTIFCIRDGFYAMMANHQYGVLATDASQVTRATIEARREVNQLVDALRSLGGPWQSLQLAATAEQIGTREGRRIHGRYRITAGDLKRGATFPDAVCRVAFGIDVHSTDARTTKGIEAKPFHSKPYDIPLRALIARDVDGLMMAGRCISGDFLAHSSYRVTGNAVAMGEAAGKVAALAARTGRLPHDVAWEEAKRQVR